MKNLAKILFFCLSLLSAGLSSCSESEDRVSPIELAYESPDVVFDNENPRMTMMGYETSERVLLVRGGQGEYRVESSDNAVAEARCEGNRLLLRPIGVGKATVIIRDESGCDYWLSVSVGYPFYKYAVIDNRVSLQGEGLTDDEKKLGAPTDFEVTVRNLKISAGAGFIVALTGEIMTMPGLPKVPAAERIDVDETGKISGLF